MGQQIAPRGERVGAEPRPRDRSTRLGSLWSIGIPARLAAQLVGLALAALVAGAIGAPAASARAAPVGGTFNQPPSHRVNSAAELAAILVSPFRGRVIIPRGTEWEMKQPCGGRDELGNCVDTP